MAEPVPFDLERLAAWLRGRLPGVEGDLTAERLTGGQSNPSWVLRCGDAAWVLRAKPAPASELLPSAHAIEREFRVQSALAETEVPVPAMHLLCSDESVIGVAFYVMEYVQGRIFREPWAPGLVPVQRSAVFDRLGGVLADLHRVDWQRLGLGDFGRQGAYFERLFSRWTRQYRASETREIPGMDALIEWLPAHRPGVAEETTIVHGDFRLENLVFAPDEPDVLAVLDWELATLGNPLVDLGYTLLAWHLSDAAFGFDHLDQASLGIPDETDFVRSYCVRTGRDDMERVLEDWPFYLACNCFRLCAILQGIAKRVEDGIASGADAVRVGALASPVAEAGWRIAQSYQPSRTR